MVNDVGVKIFGIPLSIVATGNFTRIKEQKELDLIYNETGTVLRSDTTVRIDFDNPVLWVGWKYFPLLLLSLGSRAKSPPVTLCTTYMDTNLRLALARKGGHLIFTRGGKASDAFVNNWKIIQARAKYNKFLGSILMMSMVGVLYLKRKTIATNAATGMFGAFFCWKMFDN